MSSVGNIVNFGEPFSDSDNKWSWNWLGIVIERDEKDTEHVREQVRKIDKLTKTLTDVTLRGVGDRNYHNHVTFVSLNTR